MTASQVALVALVGVLTLPAQAHCYSVWKYPTPQKCGGIYARASDPDKRKVWFVEITKVPTDVQADQRTPQEIADQAEYEKNLAAHHDELNFMLEMLRQKEAAQSALP